MSKIELDLNYEFFTMDEVYNLYYGLNKDFSNSSTKESMISFLFEFKTLEKFVKTNEIVHWDQNKLKELGIRVESMFYKNEKERLPVRNYSFLNLSELYENIGEKDFTLLINQTIVIGRNETSFRDEKRINLREVIIRYKNKKEVIEAIFAYHKERYNISSYISGTKEKNVINHQDLFLKNLQKIKDSYKITDVFDIKKIKKIQGIYSDAYVKNYTENSYAFLENENNINEIFPYVLNKTNSISTEIFDKLNKQNKALVTIYMLENNPADAIYLNYLQQTVKEQEDFYRGITNSKKVIPLIDRYTNKAVVDIDKYMKYKNSVVFQFSRKDIKDLMPHVSSYLVKNFFQYNFPSINDKLSALTYDGTYVISYRTNDKFTTEEFVRYIVENITEWITEGNDISIIEEGLERYLREKKLSEQLNSIDVEREVVKRKKI